MQKISTNELDLKLIESYASHPNPAVRRRAEILKRYSQGQSTAEVAQAVGLAIRTVQYWRHRYVEEGMSIFPELERGQDGSEDSAGLDLEGGVPTSRDSPLDMEALREMYPQSAEQAAHVQRIAQELFSQTQELHRLGDREGRLLESAALLFNIGSAQADDADPQQAAEQIGNQPLQGFQAEDQALISTLVRFQRTNPKRKRQAAAVDGLSWRGLQSLIALLRLAIFLDSSNTQGTSIQRVVHTPGELVIVVHGPAAKGDAVAAGRRGRLWSKVHKQKVRVITAEEGEAAGTVAGDLPAIKPMKRPGIEADDPLPEAARKTLRFHFAEMLRHEQGTRLGDDIEELHDMRVATRRMRVAFDVFGEVFDRKTNKRLLKALKAVGRTLGRVRDLDVFIDKGGAYLASLPAERQSGLEPLFHAWEAEREEARQRMVEFLDGSRYQQFLMSFAEFVTTPGMGVPEGAAGAIAPVLVRHAAPILIYQRLADVRVYESILENASIDQFHALRIEFKRLRYTLEYLEEILSDGAQEVIKEVKGVQDHLGDLNDADVACGILSEFLKEWEAEQQALPVSERLSTEPLVAYLAAKHAERHDLMKSFHSTWREFNRPEIRQLIASSLGEL